MAEMLGSGDPAFFHSDRDAAEAEHELQVKYDDSFNKDGTRNCYWCEKAFIPQTMVDYPTDGFTWKVCWVCKIPSPFQYKSSPIPATNALGEVR